MRKVLNGIDVRVLNTQEGCGNITAPDEEELKVTTTSNKIYPRRYARNQRALTLATNVTGAAWCVITRPRETETRVAGSERQLKDGRIPAAGPRTRDDSRAHRPHASAFVGALNGQ